MNLQKEAFDRHLVILAFDKRMVDASFRRRILESSLAVLPAGITAAHCRTSKESLGRRLALANIQPSRSWRRGMMAAAVLLAICGGVTWWSGTDRSEMGQWWLSPAYAWAEEIETGLNSAAVLGVSCRERIVIVHMDDSRNVSSAEMKLLFSSDSYRRDIYEGRALRERQWYTPEAEAMIQTSVRFDDHSFSELRHQGGFGRLNPIERLRFLVNLLPQADRLLGTNEVDGHKCVGFEIRASAYGDNPETWIDRIWFDVMTKLPVRVEMAGRPLQSDDSRTITTVWDEFEYHEGLSQDEFVPQIPEGFVEDGAEG